MRIFQIIVLVLILAVTGCASSRTVAYPGVSEPEIQQVLDRLGRLKPGMTKPQVWNVLGKLPLEDKVIWISAGSDWGEGCDSYLLRHGYSLRLLWDQTDYDNWKYRRAWFQQEDGARKEF